MSTLIYHNFLLFFSRIVRQEIPLDNDVEEIFIYMLPSRIKTVIYFIFDGKMIDYKSMKLRKRLEISPVIGYLRDVM